jgi:hypothetical protein
MLHKGSFGLRARTELRLSVLARLGHIGSMVCLNCCSCDIIMEPCGTITVSVMMRLEALMTFCMQASPKNVLGGDLKCCCNAPKTGFYRDGYCRTDESDHGRHVVCAKVSHAE